MPVNYQIGSLSRLGESHAGDTSGPVRFVVVEQDLWSLLDRALSGVDAGKKWHLGSGQV